MRNGSSILNRSINLYRDPADLSRILTTEYLAADEETRVGLALAMAVEIAALRLAALSASDKGRASA